MRKLFANIASVLIRKDRWRNIQPCDVLLCRHDANCGFSYGGMAYAHLIDSFGYFFQKRGIAISTVAVPYSRLVGNMAYHSPVTLNRAAFFIALRAHLRSVFLGRAAGVAWKIQQRKKVWLSILACAKPKLVIGILPEEGLCLACHEQGIPVYDLQHGVIADEHPWYGQKFRVGTPAEQLPTGYLVWDRASANILLKWVPAKNKIVRIIGNPWFARFYLNEAEDDLVQQVLHEPPIFGNGRPNILYTLQWGAFQRYAQLGHKGFLMKEIEDVILETAHEYNWMIRLHPVQIRGVEGRLCQEYLESKFGRLPGVEWRKSSALPLPVVLKQVSLHVTDFSTTVIESGWMGIRSAILNQEVRTGGTHESYYLEERSRGIAEVVPQDAAAIAGWIKASLLKGPVPSSAMENHLEMQNFIDEAMGSISHE